MKPHSAQYPAPSIAGSCGSSSSLLLLCPEDPCSFTGAVPFKLPYASGYVPAEDLQDVGLESFLLGSPVAVPVTETVNQKAPTLSWNVCVRARVCVFLFFRAKKICFGFFKAETTTKLAVVSAALVRDLYC